MTIRFSTLGLSHTHIFNMTNALLEAGAELVSFFGDEPERIQEFLERYPQAKQARSAEEILEDSSLDLIVSSAIPNQRADIGIQAMLHGKDFMCTKPGFTTLEQLAKVRAVQGETQRFYTVYFGERFGNAPTVKAGELVQAGAIGQVIQTTGFGPHRLLGHVPRAEWVFQKAAFGGVLNDLASHQIDQFLFFTGSTSAEIVSSHVGNFHFPQFPELEDFGDLHIRSPHAVGYIRVDWLTPQGLPTWGDVRLFLQGTEGYIEIRKNYDISGGGHQLFLVDQKSVRIIDCSEVKLPFGAQYIQDIQARTQTAMSQEHCFLASELVMQAQAQAHLMTKG